MENNEKQFLNLTPHQRLQYLIEKYFYSQKDFSEQSKIEKRLINSYINHKTQKITKKSLDKIENNVGFSIEFIQTGIGNELTDGCSLEPIKRSKATVIFPNIPEIKNNTIKEQQEDKLFARGEARRANLSTTGKNTSLSSDGMCNIIDFVYDGIKNSLVIHITDIIFCKNYNIKNGSVIIIDEGIKEEGDLVLVYYKRRHYICEFIEEELLDISINEKTKIIFSEAKIVGKVYSKVEKF